MKETIGFKDRETTANKGRLPKEDLSFANFTMNKDELDELYGAVRFEIGICSKKSYYHIIRVYINLLIDIEDVLEEIKNKYKEYEKYTFQIPFHVLELNFIVKALEDYSLNMQSNNEENNAILYRLNVLMERVRLLMKHNSKTLKHLYSKYDKTHRLALVKEIWNKLYELTGEE